MTDGDTIEACPECDDASITYHPRADHRYACRRCGVRFDKPRVRDRQHAPNVGGLSAVGMAALRAGRGDD